MTQPAAFLKQQAEARVGASYGGRWQVEGLLAIGGSAAVYRARDRDGTEVAMKVLHAEFATSSALRSRFVREGCVSNKIGHPGSVQVIDSGELDDGTAYLVLELLEGQSFENALARWGGRMQPRPVMAVVDQLLDVLDAAHANSIVHRDIKPGNLFLTSKGQLKVLDFGLARLSDDPTGPVTATGVVIGTGAYMPPEQARSRRETIDGRADVFAAGAVMFRALAGRVVHEGATPVDRMLAAMRKRAPALISVVPGIPQELAAVVDKALTFEKEGRWESAKAMQAALREAFATMPSEYAGYKYPPLGEIAPWYLQQLITGDPAKLAR